MSYCEYPDFYAETFPKARKPHQCVECAAPINVGEAHLYYRGKWDGEFSTGRQHMHCRELCMFVRDNFNSGECFGFGELEETWFDFNPHRKGTDKEKLARALMARRRWRERRYRFFSKRVNGKLFQKRYGEPWKEVEEREVGTNATGNSEAVTTNPS